MKPDKLSDAIGMADDDIIESANKLRQAHGRKKLLWVKWASAAACILLAVAVILNSLPGSSAFAIVEAKYPDMAPYPNEAEFWDYKAGRFDNEAYDEVYRPWHEDFMVRRALSENYTGAPNHFFTESISQFLSGSGDMNRVYSPLNVYMALGMLAELTDGNSRAQILELLGAESIEALRSQASDLWNASYRNDGAVTSILASSLWLDEDVNFNRAAMESLAENYYASSYRGKMGSDKFNRALQDWLNGQTGGLLKDQLSDLKLDSDALLALATTVCFSSKWRDEFYEASTAPDTFHGAGGDLTCDFMHQSDSRNYYWGDKFSAVCQSLEDGGMWFILPDEGVSVDKLLSDGETMEFILSNRSWENCKELIVNLSVPRFDVASQLDLRDGLKALGITDVFDHERSDFTPMTRNDGVYVSQVQHGARVAIDEEGCTAAAFTVMVPSGDGPPPDEEIDFTVNRPFIFVITGPAGLPLFVGVVNQPI